MTPERIRGYDDERLYQPRIHSRRIRALHRIREETGQPITVLVDQALREFMQRHCLQNDHEQGSAGSKQQMGACSRCGNPLGI
jgi:hypothetical protein